MFIVGELINASRKAVAEAIGKDDVDFIQKLAKRREKMAERVTNSLNFSKSYSGICAYFEEIK